MKRTLWVLVILLSATCVYLLLLLSHEKKLRDTSSPSIVETTPRPPPEPAREPIPEISPEITPYSSSNTAEAPWRDFAPFDHALSSSPEGENKADWSRKFGISSWKQKYYANGGPVYNHVIPQKDGSCIFVVDADGSAELQQHGTLVRKGRIGVIANMGELRSGVISVPLWLYSGHTSTGPSFEFDVEFTGNTGFDVTYHDGLRLGKKYMRQDGDFKNQQVTIEFEFDIDAGYCNVIINGEKRHTFTKEQVEADGFKWINKPVHPMYMAWAYNSSWAGGNFDPTAPAYQLTLLKRYFSPS